MINDYIVEVVYSQLRKDRALWEMTGGGRHELVRGVGARNTGVMVINSEPTSYDAVNRRALSGPTGTVLTDLMRSAELNRYNSWYTYACKWRKGGKPHTNEEIKAYRPWLLLEWKALGRPHTIITIGAAASKAVRGIKNYRPLLLESGHLITLDRADRSPMRMSLWPMIDPTTAIRYPLLQAQIEKDWERLGVWLKSK